MHGAVQCGAVVQSRRQATPTLPPTAPDRPATGGPKTLGTQSTVRHAGSFRSLRPSSAANNEPWKRRSCATKATVDWRCQVIRGGRTYEHIFEYQMAREQQSTCRSRDFPSATAQQWLPSAHPSNRCTAAVLLVAAMAQCHGYLPMRFRPVSVRCPVFSPSCLPFRQLGSVQRGLWCGRHDLCNATPHIRGRHTPVHTATRRIYIRVAGPDLGGRAVYHPPCCFSGPRGEGDVADAGHRLRPRPRSTTPVATVCTSVDAPARPQPRISADGRWCWQCVSVGQHTHKNAAYARRVSNYMNTSAGRGGRSPRTCRARCTDGQMEVVSRDDMSGCYPRLCCRRSCSEITSS